MILTLGLNHQTAALALREQLAFVPEQVGAAIGSLLSRLGPAARGGVSEAAILSTCNRTEIVCETSHPDVAASALTQAVAEHRALDPGHLGRNTYVLAEPDAVRHAFRVASGLDSMVLGEPQILGQMKQAERLARHAGGLGLKLNHLFQRTFAVAKEVRSSTAIGAQSVSLAAAAVRTAERIYGKLDTCSVLFIGAGEMIELAGAHFAARHPRAITVVNRTVERAQALAQRLQGQAQPLARLPDIIAQFDIIVSCTGSTLPIIGLGMIERAMKQRRRKPLFIVDLAVPRDVEAEVAKVNDVYVMTVDDLGRVVQSGTQARQAAVAQAEAIIETRVRDFAAWVASRDAVPLIRNLNDRAEHLRLAELQRAQKMLARGEAPDQVLERLSHALTQKFLHAPLATLHQANGAAPDERERLLQIVDRFYRGSHTA